VGEVGVDRLERGGDAGVAQAGEPAGVAGGWGHLPAVRLGDGGVPQGADEERVGQARHHQVAAGAGVEGLGVQRLDERREPGRRCAAGARQQDRAG
jgi:hypothetical protein